MLNRAQNKITCRAARDSDLNFIFKCLFTAAEESGNLMKFPHTIFTLHDALFSEKSIAEAIIAEYANEPAGVLLFSLTYNNFTMFSSPGIFVHDISVGSQFRRKGIAKQMGLFLKNIAKERGCNRIDGIIIKDNENALAFYQSMEDLKVLDYIHYMRLYI